MNQIHQYRKEDLLLDKKNRNDPPVVIAAGWWFVLLAFFLFFAGFLVWAFTGQVTHETAVQGIFLNEEGVYPIYAKAEGIVHDFDLHVGKEVEGGATLGFIEEVDPDSGAESVEEEAQNHTYITSDYSGTVLQTEIAENEWVHAGDLLALVSIQENPGDSLYFYGVVPRQNAQALAVGDVVHIDVGYAQRGRVIQGILEDANVTTANAQTVRDTFGEDTLTVVQVHVPKDDPVFQTYLDENGRHTALYNGVYSASIITAQITPAQALFMPET